MFRLFKYLNLLVQCFLRIILVDYKIHHCIYGYAPFFVSENKGFFFFLLIQIQHDHMVCSAEEIHSHHWHENKFYLNKVLNILHNIKSEGEKSPKSV